MNSNTKTNYVWMQRLGFITAGFFLIMNLEAMTGVSIGASRQFVVLPVENPQYCGNELFRAFENYYSPRISQLRSRYDLDPEGLFERRLLEEHRRTQLKRRKRRLQRLWDK